MTDKAKEQIIRPGLLVQLKTKVRGGVSYQRIDLETGEEVPEGETVARWETRRAIRNADEYKAATKVRSDARHSVERACVGTSFGLLCPQSSEADLDAFEARAHELVDAHNRACKHTYVEFYVLRGRIMASDEQAARAIASEVRDLVDRMNSAIRSGDPYSIRDAASRAAEASVMLTDEKAAVVTLAVQAARKAARTVVKRVQKGGEALATVLQELNTKPLQVARMSLLDVDAPPAASAPDEEMPAVQGQRFADIDLDAGSQETSSEPPPAPAQRSLDLTEEVE